MKIIIKLGFMLFAFTGFNAMAEGGNCPAGMYPIGGGNSGVQGCAPIPGYNSGQGQNDGSNYNNKPSQNYAHHGHWEDKYGALVFGDAKEDGTLKYFYSNYFNTESDALNSALKACNDAGDLNCRKVRTFWNGYMVLVTGEDGGAYWGHDETEASAKDRAIGACNKQTKNCEAFKTIESPAVWVN